MLTPFDLNEGLLRFPLSVRLFGGVSHRSVERGHQYMSLSAIGVLSMSCTQSIRVWWDRPSNMANFVVV